MNPGDKFIRYSKHGSSVKGVVAKSWSRLLVDFKNGVIIRKNMITSTNGVAYPAEECFLITKELSSNFLSKIRLAFLKKKKT